MDYDLVDQSADGGFLYFRDVEGGDEGSLEGRNIREFWGRGAWSRRLPGL